MHYHERRSYYVYILTNRSQALYVGVTGNLHRRVWQHQQGHGSDFCSRSKIDRLVYYESYDDVINAINREKQLKGLLRIKKIQLIVSMNPTWRDLSEESYKRRVPQVSRFSRPGRSLILPTRRRD